MPPKSNVQFRFQCKPLPKDEYLALAQIRKTYGLTTWQALIVAVRLAQQHAKEHPEALTTFVQNVHDQYPDAAPGK